MLIEMEGLDSGIPMEQKRASGLDIMERYKW
jgi:hypothetical protein